MSGITLFFSPEDDARFRSFCAGFCSMLPPNDKKPPRVSLFAKLSSDHDVCHRKLLRNVSQKQSPFRVEVRRAFTVETSAEHSTVSLGLWSPIILSIHEELQKHILATDPTFRSQDFIVPRIHIAEHVPHDIALKLKQAFNKYWSKVEEHSGGMTASGLALRNYYLTDTRWFPDQKRVSAFDFF